MRSHVSCIELWLRGLQGRTLTERDVHGVGADDLAAAPTGNLQTTEGNFLPLPACIIILVCRNLHNRRAPLPTYHIRVRSEKCESDSDCSWKLNCKFSFEYKRGRCAKCRLYSSSSKGRWERRRMADFNNSVTQESIQTGLQNLPFNDIIIP